MGKSKAHGRSAAAAKASKAIASKEAFVRKTTIQKTKKTKMFEKKREFLTSMYHILYFVYCDRLFFPPFIYMISPSLSSFSYFPSSSTLLTHTTPPLPS